MMVASVQQSGQMLGALLEGYLSVPTTQDCEIEGITTDSRQCVAGGLFIAQPGHQHHGLDFLQNALDHDVAAILCEADERWSEQRIQALSETLRVPLLVLPGLSRLVSDIAGRFYQHPSRQMSVVGVTGTNGKTSCTHFIAQALSGYQKCGVIGTIGIGFPGALKVATHTTPSAVDLQAELSDLLAGSAQAAAIEISSHGMDQARAAAVEIDLAVLTNLSRDHLDYHGSMEAYADSKRQLFKLPSLKAAIVNLDDAFGRKLYQEIKGQIDVVGYAIDAGQARHVDKWVEAVAIRSSHQGLSISLESSWGDGEIETGLLGRFNAGNLMAVFAVLMEQGMAFDQALAAISSVKTVPGRMERFGSNGQPLVVVDYAHTPDALEKALESLRPHTDGELICLFGCGGDRDKGKRPQMAAIAERLSDRVVVTDDNPRSEDGDVIIEDIVAGMACSENVLVMRNRGEAIASAIEQAQPGDTVLVAGKGHEDYQLIGDLKLDFSDRDCVASVLRELRT